MKTIIYSVRGKDIKNHLKCLNFTSELGGYGFKIRVKDSLGSKFRCTTKVKDFDIVSDATIEKGGQGQGFRPHDILESAYASCLNIFVQMLCKKMRISSDNISVKVDLTRLESRTIFNYFIEFGDNISERQKEKILKAVEECPVRKTLSRPIAFELKKNM